MLYLLLAHFVVGRGVLALLRVKLPMVSVVCLSFIIGVPVISFVPCVVQLLGLPITAVSSAVGIGIMSGLLLVPILLRYERPVWPEGGRLALYEWPFLLLSILAIGTSVWRCWYYPVTPRDMLAGTEALAEFAVREHNMVSSAFSVDLQTTNNHFKSPFVTGLQILYKQLVSPFGQLWLSVLSVSFLIWLYTMLRNTLHPLLAGVLFVMFLTIPDLYAYSFMILYDYSNMVFFFLGYYYLVKYMGGEDTRPLGLVSLLFGLATYIRTETLILVVFVTPMLVVCQLKVFAFRKVLTKIAVFLAAPALFYVVCIKVFVKRFVPVPFDLASQVNPHLSNLSPFLVRMKEIGTKLVFTETGVDVYGWFIFFFLGLLVLDLVIMRRLNYVARLALLGVVIVYVGLSFVGYLLPLADLINTTKRGLFKLLPLALLYMANSALLQRLSERIYRWDGRFLS